jgi:hypothetical protein
MNNKTESKKIKNSNLEECLAILPILLDFNELEANTQAEIIDEIRITYHNGLTDVKLASNLYWKFHSITEGDRVVKGLKNKKIYGTAFKDDTDTLKIKLDEPLKSTNETIIELRGGYNKIVGPSLQLNWNFIAANSLQYIHNNMRFLDYEEDAINCEIYFVFHAGSPCEWCETHTGKIVRLLPRKMIDNSIDELSHYNIKDPHTETAIWFNKNNIGLSQYRLCAFPHVEEDYMCHFELLSIDLKTQEYDKKRGRIERKQLYRTKYVPEKKDYEINKEERKPKKIGDGLMKYNNNIYQSVSAADANRKLDEWRKDKSLPIPVQEGSPQYRRIFEAAEKREEQKK